MALDEPKDTDNIYNINNVEYLVDKSFMEKAKPITVDFMQMGFQITSGLTLSPPSCSGCGSTSNCC